MSLEFKELTMLAGMLFSVISSATVAWVTVKISLAVLQEKVRQIERDIKDHDEVFLRLSNVMQELNTTIAKMEATLEYSLKKEE